MASNSTSNDAQSVIDAFLINYATDKQKWEDFEQFIQNKCNNLVRGRVQASITSRVKTIESLKKKLHKRNIEMKYSKDVKIENDNELDILGIRIRVFFPKQLHLAYEIIRENFIVMGTHPFDPAYKYRDNISNYAVKFGSYEGLHFWVRLKVEAKPLEGRGPEVWAKFKNRTFEIQVRSSMLFDAWAELRHDIIYKALGDKPSDSEIEILDCMKGVVKSMEVLLDHLLDAHEDRIRSDDTEIDTMQLAEQAIIRALPKLAHDRIEDMSSLYALFGALRLSTIGEIKAVFRRSKFSEEYDKFDKSRKISGQAVWTFLVEQILRALSHEEIGRVLAKVSDREHGTHEIFCRAISWLEDHLFVRYHLREKPLKPDEIERYTLLWYLHEYISASWPKSKSKLSTMLADLLMETMQRPVPRVDLSLYVAIVELIAGKTYEPPTCLISRMVHDPDPDLPAVKHLLSAGEYGRDYDSIIFRWHQHHSFYNDAKMSDIPASSVSTRLAAKLLGVDTRELNGAVLHRAVGHEEQKSVPLITELLGNVQETNTNFQNDLKQTTLTAAIIFSPINGGGTVEMILDHTDQVTLQARDGLSALLAACILWKEHIVTRLLQYPNLDVNSKAWIVPGHLAPWIDNRRLTEYISAAQWYARLTEWSKLETIARHKSFEISRSFYSWNDFFETLERNSDRYRDILHEKKKIDHDDMDVGFNGDLREQYWSTEQEMVRLLRRDSSDVDSSESETDPTTMRRRNGTIFMKSF